MSYAWRIAGDALADLRQLDPWLQEDVLDELEHVAAMPWLLHGDPGGSAVRELDRFTPDTWHVIFIRLHAGMCHHRRA